MTIDLNDELVQDFLVRVKEKATGTAVIKSVSAGQMMVKIVSDELTEMLGGSSKPLDPVPGRLNIIMLCGLQGSGKTTTAGKLARRYKHLAYTTLRACRELDRETMRDIAIRIYDLFQWAVCITRVSTRSTFVACSSPTTRPTPIAWPRTSRR